MSRHNRKEKETKAAFDSADFGLGLLTSSVKELLKPKRNDEEWSEFLLVKAGLIFMVLVGLGIFLAILLYFFTRIVH